MKNIKYLLIFILLGCGTDSVISPEPEDPRYEIKEWGTIASTNIFSTHESWNGLPGLKKAYLVLNTDSVDLKIDYTLIIRGARSWADRNTLIPIEEAPLVSSAIGLLSRDITPNYDPVEIIENGIIETKGKGYAIAFALIDWTQESGWWSVWSTVELKVSYVNVLFKGTAFEIFTFTEEVRL